MSKPKTAAPTETLAHYDVPVYRRDPYHRDRVQVDIEALATVIPSLVIAITIWCWTFWRLTSKAGYTGTIRWIFFLTMAFPFTTVWSLLLFGLIPWPIQKKLTPQKQPTVKASPVDDIEEELNRLKKKLNREK
ncbi:MAG: hypothetical protein U7123_07200 [Potamolinea sp.]